MRNGSLWSTLDLMRSLKYSKVWSLLFGRLKAHKFVQQGCFCAHYFLVTLITKWAQILTGLLCYACWDTVHQPSENTGLWQLPKVTSPFKNLAVWLLIVFPHFEMLTLCWLYSEMKWKYWSLTFTKDVQCLYRHWTPLVIVKDQCLKLINLC